MVRKNISVHIPPQANQSDTPTVQVFYKKLVEALSRGGYTVNVKKQNYHAPEIDPECLNITYHTCIQAANVINAKISYLPNYFYFDDWGYSGWSMLTFQDHIGGVSDEVAEEFYDREIKRLVIEGVSKYQQPAMKGVGIQRGYLAIFTQVPGDAVLDHAWCGSEEMLERAIEAASAVGMQIIIKTHPLSNSHKFSDFVYSLTKRTKVFVSEMHVGQLIDGAKVVCVINSGTGFESLCRLKRVVTFGLSDYGQAAYPISEIKDLSQFLADDPDMSFVRKRLKCFLYGYLDKQLNIHGSDFSEKLLTRVKIKIEKGSLT